MLAKHFMTVPLLGQFVFYLSPSRPRFNPWLVIMGFVVDKVALAQLFFKFLSFTLSVLFHQNSILLYISELLYNLSS